MENELFGSDDAPSAPKKAANGNGKPARAPRARAAQAVAAPEEPLADPFAEEEIERAAESSSEPAGGVPLMPAPTSPSARIAPPLPTRARAEGGEPGIFAGEGLLFERRYTKPGEDVFDTVEWEFRTAAITGERGEVVFEQKDCEIPKSWSMLATNVVVSKYFRGKIGTPQREHSVRQLITRVADTVHKWGKQGGYFASDEDADVFHDELKYLLLHQMVAFNSPVWFNLGVVGERPQVSACFINSVEDTMESILNLAKTEGMLFKWGSGTGTNLSVLRSAHEGLKGGGTASGPVSFMRGFDAFAGAIKCLTPDAYVYTDGGLRVLGEIIDTSLPPGFHEDASVVLATKDGPTRISHVYVSPEAATFRMKLRHTGLELRGTADHPVLTLTPDFCLQWKRLPDLLPGDRVAVSRRTEMWPAAPPAFSDFPATARYAKKTLTYPTEMTPELARLLGYMIAEGCLDEERFRFCNADADTFQDFLACVRSVFGVDPSANVRPRVNPTTGVTTWMFEACWTNAVRFLKHVGLTTEHSDAKRLPWSIRRSPRGLVAEFLRAYFEGDGHVSTHVYAASASEHLLREIQLLLLNMGMVSLLRPHPVNNKMYWSLYLRGEQAWAFVREIGFVSARKRAAAEFAGDKNTNIDLVPFLVDALRACTQRNGYFRCADGTTRHLGFGFFNRKQGGGISYDRLRSAPDVVEKVRLVNSAWADTLETILEREFFWDAVATVEPDEPAVTYDFTVPGTHSFVANGIVNHNSGGKTRRAAKMVILNSDHPDIVEFVECKADAEKKAHALIEAGYSGAFNVAGGAYDSVFFQNANHSVRATDDFMRAVELDRDWTTCNVLTGDAHETHHARDLMHKIAQAAWVCGDPGMQFDTTINRWHTCPNTARINASNPCSEYMFLDDSACNLASLNLMRFRKPNREFDTESFRHAVRVTFTAMEILVGNAAYPTDKITVNSYDYRPLGLGYANLGALLMARGVPYDSDEGRAHAAAITAIMCGEAYHQSAKMARRVGPFAGYERNRQPFLRVMQMHRDHVEAIHKEFVPDDLIEAARESWDNTLELGAECGFRNAQATVLAPTGCLVAGSLVLTDRGLMRLGRLGDVEGARWQDVDFQVLTDEGERTATKFYVNGVEATRRIVTRSGYAIQGTLKHRVKVVDQKTGALVWKRFAEITPGDVVPLSMGRLAGQPRTVNLPPLGEEYWTGDYTTRAPRTMTPELAELIGYFMGDGSLHAKGPRFCVANADADVAERVKTLVKALFNLDAHVTPQQGYCEVSVHSVPLAMWWEACGFAKRLPAPEHRGKGYVPHIPDAILATNDPAVYGAFLRGLYEADGTVTGGVPCWSTVQRGFSEEVKTLLLALGIPTTTRETTTGWGNSTAYVLRLRNASYAGRFLEAVGFLGARKAGAITRSAGEQTARYDYIYVAPETLDALVPAGHPLYNAAVLSRKRHTGAITRRTAEALFARTGDERLGHALGFFYDAITANEDGGLQATFDLSVPANVTYIAQGFISHNTIGFMMDCDTTGVEPDIAIVKFKSLVGGGMFKIVNQTVPEALERLGYSASERKAILDYIEEHDTIEGAPGLAPEHLPVFDCAFRARNGTRTIHYMGHVRMIAAVQPFLSGAVSKTVNMPNDATPEEIAEAYLQSWKLGIKALAIYRDGSKKTQPLSTGATVEPEEKAAEVRPFRRKLPNERQSLTHKFSVGGHEGYLTVGLYPEGAPGEIFIVMSKEGSVVSGLMDSFATAISLALQYGVPLKTLVEKFMHTRFEPSGFTGNPDVPMAKSIMDYLFRYLALKFLPSDERAHVGLIADQQDEYDNEGSGLNGLAQKPAASAAPAAAPPSRNNPAPGPPAPAGPTGTPVPTGEGRATAAERQVFVTQADAPPCPECGGITSRNGACYRCDNCGTSIGCS